MPGIDAGEKTEEAETAPAVVVTEKPAEATTDVTPAESSPADKKGEKGDLLAAVSAALAPKKEKSPDSEKPDSEKSEADPADAEKDGDAPVDPDDLSEEELARLKPKTRKRIDGLLADRSRLTTELDAAKPKADELDKMVGWFKKSNLDTSEVNQLFDVGAKLKNDPHAAFAIIKPIFEQLQQMVGEVLPEDLHRQVAQGVVTLETAQELSRARSTNKIAEQTLERSRKVEADRTANETHQAHVGSVQKAVSEWETSKAKADPDWKLKQPQVMRAIELAIHRQGYPKTVEDGVKIANEALKTVNAEMKGFAPRRKEMTTPTATGSSAVTPKPSSFMDYINAGLAKGKAG